MERFSRIVLIVGMVLLLGLGVWFRVDSLGRYPEVDGDEAWHAVQLLKMLRGQSFSIRTETGLPLSPFHAALELPVLLILPGSLTILRIPTVITGLLAIVLMYILGSRMIGRRAAAIAAVLLAVLPVAIIYSRTGYESSHAPLYTLLLIVLAHRLRTRFVAALLLCAYFVHPTNIFILPVLIAVVASRTFQESMPGEKGVWRRLIFRAVGMSTVVLTIGVLTLIRPVTGKISETYGAGLHSPHDPGAFLRRLGRLYLGLGNIGDSRAELAIWAGIAAITALAAVRLYRQRHWDSLALIGGTGLSAAVLFAVGGSNILQPGMARYGLFLVVPGVLSLACVVDALAVVPTGRSGPVFRVAYAALAITMGWALTLSLDLERLTPQRVLALAKPIRIPSQEEPGPWLHPMERVLARIEAERARKPSSTAAGDRSRAARHLIISDGAQTTAILQYLAMGRGEWEVVNLLKLGRNPDHWFPRLRNLVARGAFAVGEKGGFLEIAMESVLPGTRLERRTIQHDGGGRLLVYHLRTDIRHWQPVLGDFDGDGCSDLAAHRFETSDWFLQTIGGHPERTAFGPPGQGIPTPADYDGDGRTDLAVYLPDGTFWLVQCSTADDIAIAWGDRYGVPVPGDYDGDGRAEFGTFVPAVAQWRLPDRPPFEYGRGERFGGTPVPVPGDYDGDGRTDVAVFEVSDATWSIMASREGGRRFPFGPPNGIPVPGDYDGDGRTDAAVFDPATGDWHLRRSTAGDIVQRVGNPDSIPVPGDYDGDGRTDLVAYDPKTGVWQRFARSSGEAVVQLGRISEEGQIASGPPENLTR